MKNLKSIVLGIVVTGLVTVGLFACSNDETNNSKQENTEKENVLQSKNESDKKIGQIAADGTVQPLIDTEEFKTLFLEHNLLTDIETVEIDNNYLTIIGKDVNNFKLRSYQVKLIREGSNLFFPSNPPIEAFTTHTCTGNGCSSCSFTKNTDKKITGCSCGGSGSCSHSVEEEEGVSAADVLEIIALTISILLMV